MNCQVRMELAFADLASDSILLLLFHRRDISFEQDRLLDESSHLFLLIESRVKDGIAFEGDRVSMGEQAPEALLWPLRKCNRYPEMRCGATGAVIQSPRGNPAREPLKSQKTLGTGDRVRIAWKKGGKS